MKRIYTMLLALVVAMAALAQVPSSWKVGDNVIKDLGMGDVDPKENWSIRSNFQMGDANGAGSYGDYWQGVGQKFLSDYIDKVEDDDMNGTDLWSGHEDARDKSVTCAGYYVNSATDDDLPNIYQVVHMPAGYYKLRVQALYRDINGSASDFEDKMQAVANSIPTPGAHATDFPKNAWIYANVLSGEDADSEPVAEYETFVKHLVESDVEENLLTWGDPSWRNDLSINKKKRYDREEGEWEYADYYYPRSALGASFHFAKGNYWNEMEFLVTEDSYVRIGLKKTANSANDWLVFSEWQVIYQGAPTLAAVQKLWANEASRYKTIVSQFSNTDFGGFDKNAMEQMAEYMSDEFELLEEEFGSQSDVNDAIVVYKKLQERGYYYEDTFDLMKQLSFVMNKSMALIEKGEYPNGIDAFQSAYNDVSTALSKLNWWDDLVEKDQDPYTFGEELFNKIVEARGDYLDQQDPLYEDGPKDFSAVINHPWMVNDGEEPTYNAESETWTSTENAADDQVDVIRNSTTIKNEWYETAEGKGSYCTGIAKATHSGFKCLGENYHGGGSSVFSDGYYGIAQNVMGLPDGFYSLVGFVYNANGLKGEKYNNIYMTNSQGDVETSNMQSLGQAWEEVETGIIEVSDKQLTIGGQSDGFGYYTGFRLYFWGKVPPAKKMIEEKIKKVREAESKLTDEEEGAYSEFAGDKKYIDEQIAKIDLNQFDGLADDAIVSLYREYKGYLDDASKYINAALKQYKNFKAKKTYQQIETDNEEAANANDVAAIIAPASAAANAIGTNEADTYQLIDDANKLADKYAEYIKKYQEAYSYNAKDLNDILADQKSYMSENVVSINTLDACIQKLDKFIARQKMKDLGGEDATEENPADLTSLIVNPSFDLHQVDGEWKEILKVGEDGSKVTLGEDGEIWERGYADGWHGLGINDYSETMKLSRGICELWNAGTGEFYQEFAGLPAGTYEISCMAVYRDANDLNEDLVAAFKAAGSEDKWENRNAVLFARTSLNGETVDEKTDYIKALERCESDDYMFRDVVTGYNDGTADETDPYVTEVTVLGLVGDEDKYPYVANQNKWIFIDKNPETGNWATAEYNFETGEWKYTDRDSNVPGPFDIQLNGKYYPNSMYGIYTWFEKERNTDMLRSTVRIEVKSGETLRLGLRKDKGITNDNLTFDDFTFKYLSGDQFKEEETGIEDVTPVKVEKSTVLYNTAGQIVDDSYKGIVIDSEGNKFIKK